MGIMLSKLDAGAVATWRTVADCGRTLEEQQRQRLEEPSQRTLEEQFWCRSEPHLWKYAVSEQVK